MQQYYRIRYCHAGCVVEYTIARQYGICEPQRYRECMPYSRMWTFRSGQVRSERSPFDSLRGLHLSQLRFFPEAYDKRISLEKQRLKDTAVTFGVSEGNLRVPIKTERQSRGSRNMGPRSTIDTLRGSREDSPFCSQECHPRLFFNTVRVRASCWDPAYSYVNVYSTKTLVGS